MLKHHPVLLQNLSQDLFFNPIVLSCLKYCAEKAGPRNLSRFKAQEKNLSVSLFFVDRLPRQASSTSFSILTSIKPDEFSEAAAAVQSVLTVTLLECL